jgi:hypothetical protein
MKAGDWKMVVQTLASGQKKAYAPEVNTFRVFFHVIPYGPKPTKVWEPARWADNRDYIERYLRAVHDWQRGEDEPDALGVYKLQFLKRVGPGVWEFSVSTPFTD